MDSPDEKEDILIIGIDFGTTQVFSLNYSGVAWAYSGEPNEIELVTSWNAEYRRCSDVEKTPTQLFYGSNDKETWGYGVPLEKNGLKWFKLLLLNREDVPQDVYDSKQFQEALQLQKNSGKTAVEIVACFLRHLWNHSLDSMTRTIGVQLFSKCKFRVVITLPAIWPHSAQQRMKHAAQLSGILLERPSGPTKLRFISEPEAAALATLKDVSKRTTTKTGDTVLVVDAGGGTVDLISYVIESMKPFVVRECVKGDGGLCGGIFLDEAFLELVKRRVTVEAWRNVSKAEEKRFLNDEWEQAIKPQFHGEERKWMVELPDSCYAVAKAGGRKRRRTIVLDRLDILSIFRPAIEKIENLVTHQSNAVIAKFGKRPSYVVLVGGFGRNPYLFDRLRMISGIATEVLQSRGAKPWTAICRGAVVHGLTTQHTSSDISVKVESRVARRSYGISFATKWRDDKHLPQDKYLCHQYLEWKAKDQMRWFLIQGEDMESTNPVRHEFQRLFELTDTCESMSEYIFSSAAFMPPSRKDASVAQLCTIKWSESINVTSLPTWRNSSGKVFYKLVYVIEMTCDDGTAGFAIYHKGKRVGERNVDLEFH